MSGYASLAKVLSGLEGRAGMMLAQADGRELFAHDADSAYPAASVIKLPLVMALYAEAAAGRLSLDERLAVGTRVDGSGVLRHLRDLNSASLRDLATVTLIASDNTATNRLIERVGIERVNEHLERWGCETTRLRRAMYDLEARREGRENVMTARETAGLLGRLMRGELVNRATSDAVVDLLARNSYEARLGRYLPAGVWLAHKEGNSEGVRNDAGVVQVRSAVIAAGFCCELSRWHEGDSALGLLGWHAYRAAGGEGDELPPGLERVV